jgi:hypothetical protein
MSRKRSKKLTEDKKDIIIESYRRGIKPQVVAAILKKSPRQVHNFYSRWKLDCDLPPKDINKSTILNGRWACN